MANDQYAHRHGMGVFGWVMGALLVLLLIGMFAGPWLWAGYSGTMPAYYAYPHPFFGWFFFPFGFIFLILFCFFAFRWLWFPWGRRYYGGWGHWSEPEEILRRRYARGEITKDQFDQMMRDLEQRK